MTNDKSVTLSQGLEVLVPKGGNAFPILCSEWDSLREEVAALELEPWAFQFIGSTSLGIAAGALIGLVSGSISDQGNYKVITWAVLVSSLLIGLLALFFAKKEKEIHRAKAQGITRQMRFIEERFDRSQIAVSASGPGLKVKSLNIGLLREMGAFSRSRTPPSPPDE